MESRIIDLEMRLTEQEAALEALTRTVVRQQTAIDGVLAELRLMKALLRELSPAAAGPASEEPPPPHY